MKMHDFCLMNKCPNFLQKSNDGNGIMRYAYSYSYGCKRIDNYWDNIYEVKDHVEQTKDPDYHYGKSNKQFCKFYDKALTIVDLEEL